MKDTEKKLAFIEARAAGKSYSTIAKELGISKSTCTTWSRELDKEIADLKAQQLEELYEAYGMMKEARIRHLGDTLQAINDALAEKDLSEIPAEKLLELSLKYQNTLKEEYIEPVEDTGDTQEDLLKAYHELYKAAKQGQYTPNEINAQMTLLEKRQHLAANIEHKKEWGFLDDLMPYAHD